jgi:hypothetical protein
MKKNVFLILTAVLLFASCEVKQSEKNPTGKVLDVLVAANHGNLSESTNALVDSVFSQSQCCLPQPEHRFNMVKIPLGKLSSDKLFQAYRCIVKCDIGKNNKDKVFIDHDKWVKPQVYIVVSATCEDSLCALLRRYEPQIVNAIYDTEHQRFINLYSGSAGNSAIVERLKKKYGFTLSVGSNYRWLKEKDDFVWVQEKLVEQSDKFILSNLLIQTVPYKSQEQFGKKELLDRLDTMLCRYVPGGNPGSYAGIERDTTLCEVLVSYVDYPGAKYAVQTRGLWGLRETNDRMGGPFVAYSILSPDGTTVVDVMGLVYAPKLEKRDFLLKLESMASSVRW